MHVLIQVDGGSRGNPGPAAAGVSITDAGGTALFEAGFHLAPMTNNQAEYHGLLYALREARRIGATKLDIQADSELLVRQINGQYKVKNEGLRPLYERAIKDLRTFESWRMVHVRREFNARADQLANRAMDAGDDVIEGGDGGANDADIPRPAPVAQVAIRCTTGANSSVCPAPCKPGWSVMVGSTTPSGLCIHAASSVLEHVSVVARSRQPKTIACPVADCGARFGVGTAER